MSCSAFPCGAARTSSIRCWLPLAAIVALSSACSLYDADRIGPPLAQAGMGASTIPVVRELAPTPPAAPAPAGPAQSPAVQPARETVPEFPEDAGTLPQPAQTPSVPPARAPAETDDDLCPEDPNKLEPGRCGCGLPEVDGPEVASCDSLRAALAHRYAFNGTGAVARDSVGDDDALLRGVTLTGDGTLKLDQRDARQYLELPAGLLSDLPELTIELWTATRGSNTAETVFELTDLEPDWITDFFAPAPAPTRDTRSALYLCTRGAATHGSPVAGFITPQGAAMVLGKRPLSAGRVSQLVVVVSSSARALRLYVDGQLQGSTPLAAGLEHLRDRFNGLGVSPAQAANSFNGAIHELRVYSSALDEAQVLASFHAGTDPAFLE